MPGSGHLPRTGLSAKPVMGKDSACFLAIQRNQVDTLTDPKILAQRQTAVVGLSATLPGQLARYVSQRGLAGLTEMC